MAGLFVGCDFAAVCPSAILDDAEAISPSEYRSPFDSWDDRASVRSAPKRTLSDDPTIKHLFSPDLVPLAQHPAVQALDDATMSSAIANHTYRYLNFTTVLENLVVNPVAGAISRGALGLKLPAQMRLDAHKIHCDEAYHALLSADLSAQIEARTGLAPTRSEAPYFLGRLSVVRAGVEPHRRSLVDLLFVICSEMLITATLTRVQLTPGVEPAVFEAVRDHALDEGRHHAYFQQLLKFLWAQLQPRERIFSSRTMPSLVGVFMEPDLRSMHDELKIYGFGDDDARRILSEVFPRDIVAGSASAAAAHLVRSLQELDAFDDSGTVDAFASAGIHYPSGR